MFQCVINLANMIFFIYIPEKSLDAVVPSQDPYLRNIEVLDVGQYVATILARRNRCNDFFISRGRTAMELFTDHKTVTC